MLRSVSNTILSDKTGTNRRIRDRKKESKDDSKRQQKKTEKSRPNESGAFRSNVSLKAPRRLHTYLLQFYQILYIYIYT